MKKIAALLALCLFFPTASVHAQAASVSVEKNEVVLDFPNTLLFSAKFSSNNAIEKVMLHYGTSQDTCGNVSAVGFPEFTSGKKVAVDWEWDMRQSGGEPPGTTIWWQWETVDSSGTSQLTDRQQITWIDDVHPWEVIDRGQVRLHHYYSDTSIGETLADAAVSALAHLKKNIGMLPEEPIDLYMYDSTEALVESVFYVPGWTGGLAYSDYNILLIGMDPSDLEWGKSTVAHELTHILEGDYSFSCLGDTPTWLSEGLAMYGEGGPEEASAANFEQNVNADSLLSFRVLSGGFSEDADIADLSYTQSYYMVNYLIQNYGKDKMLQFLDLLSSAGGLDESLQQAYGFDLDGFENEWRDSLGLSALESAVQAAMPTPTIIPTIIPIQGAQAVTGVVLELTPTTDSVASVTEGVQTAASDSMVDPVGKTTKVLFWVLIIAGANCLLLLILFLIFHRKGGQK